MLTIKSTLKEKLDESTAHRQLKSPRSLSGRFKWSANGHGHGHLLPPPLCNVNRPSHSDIQLFQNLTMKIHGEGHVCGQRSRSHLTFNIQRSRSQSRSNPLSTVEAWGSIDMFVFRFMAIGPFWAATKQLYEWFSPSVCLSVTPFWLCSCHCIIMKFSEFITIDRSDVHANGQGQRSRSQRSWPHLAVSGL